MLNYKDGLKSNPKSFRSREICLAGRSRSQRYSKLRKTRQLIAGVNVGSFDQVNLREWEKVQLGRQTEAASRDPEWHARKPVCAGTEAPFFLN